MRAALEWAGDHDEEPAPAPLAPVKLLLQPGDALPRHVAAAIWRGVELGSPVTSVVSSGFQALDAELPGHGWPCGSLIEVLQAQPSVAECGFADASHLGRAFKARYRVSVGQAN